MCVCVCVCLVNLINVFLLIHYEMHKYVSYLDLVLRGLNVWNSDYAFQVLTVPLYVAFGFKCIDVSKSNLGTEIII